MLPFELVVLGLYIAKLDGVPGLLSSITNFLSGFDVPIPIFPLFPYIQFPILS